MTLLVKIARRIINFLKRLIFTEIVKYQALNVGRNLIVNHYSNVTSKTILANNVNFNGLIIKGGGNVSIGNNFHSGSGCIILTSIHNYDSGEKIPYDESTIQKDVIIGDNVWLGINVTILPGITIGEGAIIQAGSVVTSNIPDCAIAGGHPARIFKYRNKIHYYGLKEKNKVF